MRYRYGPPWGPGPPPWWPAGEQWPPRRPWRRGPARFFRRMALAALAMFLLVNIAVTALAFNALRAIGLVDVPAGAAFLSGATAIVLLVAVVGLVVVGAGFRRAARPLGEVMEAAERVASGDYSARVDARGPAEVRRLTGSFNAMVERLESAESQRRRLLADVTHELRTPLSVIQGQIEGALDGVYPRDDATLRAVLDEARHMSRIIEDLRLLSLAESGALRLDRRPLDVRELADDVLGAYRAQAETAQVALAMEIPADLPAADADATRVREVLENLLSNALRYTPAGGRVVVAARREGERTIALSIADTGRGVPAAELPQLFDRFHRSPDSRGSGLGLAIARDLVRAHGGEISASSDGEGRGTTVRFTLPVATR